MSEYLIKIKLKENCDIHNVLSPLIGLFIEELEVMTPTTIYLEDL